MYTNTPDGTKRIKCRKPLSEGELVYIFLCLLRSDFLTYEQYRDARASVLEACLMVVKYKFAEALDMVGIPAEPARVETESPENLLYLDASGWSAELDIEAAKLQKELKILNAPTESYFREKDYPD